VRHDLLFSGPAAAKASAQLRVRRPRLRMASRKAAASRSKPATGLMASVSSHHAAEVTAQVLDQVLGGGAYAMAAGLAGDQQPVGPRQAARSAPG
jgi:hypothetical protein